MLYAYLAGILYGALYSIAGYLADPTPSLLIDPKMFEGLIHVFLLPLSLDLYRKISRKYLIDSTLKNADLNLFNRYEKFTYFVFLGSFSFLIGIKPTIAFTLASYLSLVSVQTLLFFLALNKNSRFEIVTSERYIAALFLLSGFSALIYQIVWQRVLFTAFGINSESVTVIVSVFMFGLGVGALLGGYLLKKFPQKLLILFLVMEVSIGLFGLVSIDLIHYIRSIATHYSILSLVAWVYLILSVPTLLMGATLPILVAYLQTYFNNIGKTVGVLYSLNTFGSAIAAFLTVTVVFVFFGQRSSVLIAAVFNFATAILIYQASRMIQQRSISTEVVSNDISTRKDAGLFSFPVALMVLMAIGYITLSQEILWFRLLGYITGSKPQVFGLLLAFFLLGVGWGSVKSKNLTESTQSIYWYILTALLIATALFYLAIPLVSAVSAYINKDAAVLVCYLLIGLIAYATGGIFPLLIHLGVNNKSNAANSVSWLYFANIIGATMGPLVTGFVLLDFFDLKTNIIIICACLLALFTYLLWKLPQHRNIKFRYVASVFSVTVLAFLLHPKLYENYLERIQHESISAEPFKDKVENRVGIITISKGEKDTADILFGNGIYDGRFNTDPVSNSNLIDRAYMVAALHKQPKNVLEIGLSTGSWAYVMLSYSNIESMTSVEINKGYPDLIENYPEINQALKNPKLNFVYDDGRRWLNSHPNDKFDFILMNTTFHWRSNSTNLLSREFFQLCKNHLHPDGVIYFNTTFSRDTMRTAAEVFKYVISYTNFIAASDHPFDLTKEEKRENFLKFVDESGSPYFEKNQNYKNLMETYTSYELNDIRQSLIQDKALEVITDDNMLVEYKR